MSVLSTICLPKFRLVRGIAACLLALVLVIAPVATSIGTTTGPLDSATKLTKLALDVDDGADVCLYCGARCHCQQPTMDGPQSSISPPGFASAAVVEIFELPLRSALIGPPDRPPKA